MASESQLTRAIRTLRVPSRCEVEQEELRRRLYELETHADPEVEKDIAARTKLRGDAEEKIVGLIQQKLAAAAMTNGILSRFPVLVTARLYLSEVHAAGSGYAPEGKTKLRVRLTAACIKGHFRLTWEYPAPDKGDVEAGVKEVVTEFAAAVEVQVKLGMERFA